MDQPHGVVSIQVDPKVAFANLIMLNCIEFPQHGHEVSGMLLANILDAEIINAEREGDGTPRV